MHIPFLIMLREGIEAGLIVGIIASYLRQTGHQNLMVPVWIGIVLAIAASLFCGAALLFVAADFPQKEQELFEAVVSLAAVVMLTSMVFWMRQNSSGLKRDLQKSIDRVVHQQSTATAWALVAMAFLAVAREGLESVF